ncbi:DUF3800 domain-containing protein [Antribacter sp. KLBMP9083]|uniref:DUF3800 domain-containing protein n=1 Tax=Antribacter soli TaxID=2910976 RepID=A0AA41U913_9MICO|nr:DUF3800 domain-containing protein [Antribacter soli]MCF4123030.1 DUF3800 domain-containing protein [Antribacter soli]
MPLAPDPSRLVAYIDESGDPSPKPTSSRHFVMTAVVFDVHRTDEARDWLAKGRTALGRQPGQLLHFTNLKKPGQRDRVAHALAHQEWGTFISVVACKDHLVAGDHVDDDTNYLYTFRFLLERLSWYARRSGMPVSYTLAHKHRFKLAKLREYEAILRSTPEPRCKIAWQHVDPAGGSIDQPKREELLQIADLATSATAAAFTAGRDGKTHPEYLGQFASRLYRHGSGENALTSYGLKMHPWRETTKAAYPWVAAL